MPKTKAKRKPGLKLPKPGKPVHVCGMHTSLMFFKLTSEDRDLHTILTRKRCSEEAVTVHVDDRIFSCKVRTENSTALGTEFLIQEDK